MLKKYYEFHRRRREFYARNGTLHTIISLGSLLFWLFAFKSTVLDANNIPSGSMEPTLMIGDFLFVNKMRYGINIPFTEKRFWRYDEPDRGDIVTFTPPEDSPLHGKTLVKRVVGVPGDTITIRDDEVSANGVSYPARRVQNRQLLEQLGSSDPRYLDLFREKVIDPATGQLKVEHYILKQDIIKEYQRARRYHGDVSSGGWSAGNGFLRRLPDRVFAPLRRATERFMVQKVSSERMNRMRNPDRKWVIPEGYYMVMGDNRDNSDDSRGCSLVAGDHNRRQCARGNFPEHSKEWGLIPIENIQGKVFLSYFSVNWGAGSHPLGNPVENLFHLISGEFSGSYVRWGRIFNRIY